MGQQMGRYLGLKKGFSKDEASLDLHMRDN